MVEVHQLKLTVIGDIKFSTPVARSRQVKATYSTHSDIGAPLVAQHSLFVGDEPAAIMRKCSTKVETKIHVTPNYQCISNATNITV